MSWDMGTNYLCPSVVHHPTNNNYVHLTDCVLPNNSSTTKISEDSQTQQQQQQQSQVPLVQDELRHDGMNRLVSQTHSSNNSMGSSKQNFSNVDLNGSKVIRLVRAKQATKRKSSLDTLIEVVQKELLRVNGQSTSTSPSASPPHYSQTRTTSTCPSSKPVAHRSMVSSALPSSHSASLTSQSFKNARKNRVQNQTKRLPTHRHRTPSINNDESINDMDAMDQSTLSKHHDHQHVEQQESIEQNDTSTENIEEIVRDTVDKLVAITLLNNAPFIVNMLTAIPGTSSSTNPESKPSITSTTIPSTGKVVTPSSEYYRNDLALLSSTASDIRNSMQLATSPSKQSQPIIFQPAPLQTNASFVASDSIKRPSTPTVFVAPRLLNFQTVVPKPTTNIQIGNTKIILVSPSTTAPSLSHQTAQQQHQTSVPSGQCLINSNPIKLVKLTPSPTSALTLPKNVQIVLPARTSNESPYRPVTKLTTCALDQIPQAAQEVTITTSPPLNAASTINKPRRRSSTSTPTEKPVGKILRPIAKVLPVYSPNNSNHAVSPLSTVTTTNPTHDEILQPMTVNISQALPRTASTHGPMIYRMTSVNSNVPVFRVRATTAPTGVTMKNDSKPITLSTATSLTYEPKQIHNTTTGGSVSVVACIKTTKKRNKERAIMPRPSATDPVETSSYEFPQRLSGNTTNTISTVNGPMMVHNHTNTGNTSVYPLSSELRSVPVRIVHPSNLPVTSMNHSTTHLPLNHDGRASSSSVSTRLSMVHSGAIKSATPSRPNRPLMEDKGIQCIDDEDGEEEEFDTNSTEPSAKKRADPSSSDDDGWTVAADALLRDVLSQYGFRFLDVHCQQNLSSKFDTIQANLVSGMIPTREEFHKAVVEIKENLLQNGLSKISADNLEKLFQYFESEYSNIYNGGILLHRTNDRKRTRRQ